MNTVGMKLKDYIFFRVSPLDTIAIDTVMYKKHKSNDWDALKKYEEHVIEKADMELNHFTGRTTHRLVLGKDKEEYTITVNGKELTKLKMTEDDLKGILEVENDGTFYEEDIINKPNHYHRFKIEVIEIIKILIEGNHNYKLTNIYYIGNVIKYIFRAGLKGDFKEDLRKARYYLDKIIEG